MIKKIALLACAGIMALALTGCGVSVAGVQLPENMAMSVGDSAPLALTYTYDKDEADADAKQKAIVAAAVTWSVEGDAVTVDDAGTITAQASGEAAVTACTKDGKTASCIVTVTQPIKGITLLSTLTLAVGGEDQQTLAPELTPAGAQGVITWSSSDEAVATVDASGTVTAVSKGDCTIKAEANGVSAETTVTVTVAPTGITLAQSSGILTIGNSTQLKVYTVPEAADAADTAQLTYKSNNESVATVDASGTIKAKKAGAATITVTYQGIFMTEYRLTVMAPVQQPTKPTAGSAGGTSSKPVTGTPSAPSGGATPNTPAGGSTVPAPAPTPAPAPDPPPTSTPDGGHISDSPFVTLDPNAPEHDLGDLS